MINLLPKAFKEEIRAARANVVLIRYIFIIFIAFAFLALILVGSIVLLNITKQSSEQLIEANATEAAQYSETSNEIQRLSASLTTSQSVLNEQITYSKVLQSIAAVMPAGSVIGELALDDTSFNGQSATNMKIYAKTNDIAIQLGQTLQTVPGISSAKINSISDSDGIADYPFSATLTVTLTRSLGR